LITGRGRYAADWNLPGQLHACFLRSDCAHAEIVALDVGPALKCRGVVAVYTGADAVAAGCMAFLPTLANATLDALRPLGIQHLDMPLTPSKLWHAMQAARTR